MDVSRLAIIYKNKWQLFIHPLLIDTHLKWSRTSNWLTYSYTYQINVDVLQYSVNYLQFATRPLHWCFNYGNVAFFTVVRSCKWAHIEFVMIIYRSVSMSCHWAHNHLHNTFISMLYAKYELCHIYLVFILIFIFCLNTNVVSLSHCLTMVFFYCTENLYHCMLANSPDTL